MTTQLTVYKLHDGAPVIIFDFKNPTLAELTKDRISLLCTNTNEYLWPLSKERKLTDEEKGHVVELLRYNCRPKDAEGTVFGVSQKHQGYYPLGPTITKADELFDHLMKNLNLPKNIDITFKEITKDDLLHWSEDPRYGYANK